MCVQAASVCTNSVERVCVVVFFSICAPFSLLLCMCEHRGSGPAAVTINSTINNTLFSPLLLVEKVEPHLRCLERGIDVRVQGCGYRNYCSHGVCRSLLIKMLAFFNVLLLCFLCSRPCAHTYGLSSSIFSCTSLWKKKNICVNEYEVGCR